MSYSEVVDCDCTEKPFGWHGRIFLTKKEPNNFCSKCKGKGYIKIKMCEMCHDDGYYYDLKGSYQLCNCPEGEYRRVYQKKRGLD